MRKLSALSNYIRKIPRFVESHSNKRLLYLYSNPCYNKNQKLRGFRFKIKIDLFKRGIFMNINIAGNLKRLRKQREITQEDLANFIGVSFQAVSKWECGDGYPDITILPALANFFEVTLDELVGMNEIKNAKKLEEIKEQQRKITVNGGTIKESIELLRGALKIFPNDYWLLSELAASLYFDNNEYYDNNNTEEQKKKNDEKSIKIEESIKISERILEFCTDSEIRNRVQAIMCRSLNCVGEKDKAIELAKKLPSIDETRNSVLASVLDGKEKRKQYQANISMFTQYLLNHMQSLVSQAQNDGYYTGEERLKLYQKVINICKAVYEEEDFDLAHLYVCYTYLDMAKIYIEQDNENEAVKSLQAVAKLVTAYFNQLHEMRKYKSLFVNMQSQSVTIGFNFAKHIKNWIESEHFESIRDREEIKKIIDELDKYAN